MNRTELIETLQRRIDDAILPRIGKLEQLILLDFPNHANVGDSAIYGGQLAFFKQRLQATQAIVSDGVNVPWERIADAGRDVPIFLHGGGNFGDLWPEHQDFREAVLERFPGRLVVQLPQSIHYKDPARLARTAEVIARHGNFVLLVRDEESFEIARRHLRCDVQRCPDMAFYLGPLERIGRPERELLLLLRQDREKGIENPAEAGALPPGTLVADWLDDDKNMKARVKTAAALNTLLKLRTDPMALRQDYFERLALNRLRRGIRMLSSSNVVITDRLHVHIVSTLLDIPHVVLDNSYGKVSRFIRLWTAGFSGMSRADSLAQALASYGPPTGAVLRSA
ncbi:MAG TPA: polysaccharide pyruvyl transferase family protein [Burkholderiaceae bacterium]|nr:polysaccharide pyruvyl transferase family protein [Burkholderiaceae bacterium]